ncbi:family 78 glycoside hydrolase catalytic domain [Streptomyces turgidiscabies]|uniref:alpha-L-rhamnosidase n=1 Tax=Streptomyces turgidiscabies (strain Car8) TaxID=698760 RepID=L7EUE5_STRT8|nr:MULTISPECIES: alpha-L-rhamnosidase [Streptomyces]ELP63023.1 bacterial alpha-L-rhamnosidase [Streptomyces turgidiscabies Car8]MDX3496599.1 family 78 glycoside hydrolase catalytic domain [Streptomyces turgidiscabies]GAQ72795.1 bacterial alpha-L-rhamnosidase [Streptomyces turgidiscabies]
MTAVQKPTVQVHHVRVGWTDETFVPDPRPPLTWKTSAARPSWIQRAAEISVTRDSGETFTVSLDAPDSVLVDWPFAPLAPGETACVRVRVHGADGSASAWSADAPVTAGFLPADAWEARFVGSGSDEPHLLRGTFEARGRVNRALLRTTAFGAYDVQVNGVTVDDAELKPGWTSYQWRLSFDVADVTEHIRPGRNALGVVLAGGWYTERYGFRDAARRFYEGAPAAAARLTLEYEDGSVDTVTTDESWTWSRGPVVSASLYRGETYDARLDLPGWSTPSFDASAWTGVELVAVPDVTPTMRTLPPVRVIERLPVERVVTTPSGATVLDFGQNLVGRVRVRVRGERGHTVTLRHAEVLEHGELGTRPLRNAAAADHYVLSGAGEEVWEPKWTFHGFRYVQVDNWPGALDVDDVSAAVIHTDMSRTGGFATSHPLLQRFHDNVVWGMRGNFLSLPTDCPQRDERLGWTGDMQVFAPTAAFLYDCDAFLRSWLEDLVLEQRAADGVVPMVVPAVIPQVPGLFQPVAAWGDAVTVVPDVLWECFADRDVLQRSFDAMAAWVDVVHSRTKRTLLWEEGLQFGDWLDPDAPPERPGDAKTDAGIVATAYFFRSAALTSKTAALLGRDADARRYADLAARIADAFRSAYVTPRGRMMSDAPTAYALAIVFGLAEAGRCQALGDRLRDLVRAAGYRITTGFVGTPIICEALTATGHTDAASRLLTQTECPSWLYPVTMGATTVWERWDSMLDDGSINPGQMTSFNHYALGAVADWLHRRVAGLAPMEPGYRVIHVSPVLLDDLDDASAWHETPYGRATAGWRREGDRVRFHVEIPPNTRGVVELPGGARHEIGSGTHTWVEEHPRPGSSRGRLTLSSSLTTIIDDQPAYEAVLAAIRGVDASRAESFRRTTRWRAGRALREPLDKAPLEVLAAVEKALAALPDSDNGH